MKKVSALQAANPPSANSLRPEDRASAIDALLGDLPAQERNEVLKKLTELWRPIPAPRAGDVLEAVVVALPNRRDWTVEELRKTVEQQGVQAKPKEVYNAIGYLTRTGRIRRVGYGRYVVDGVEVVTADDLGGESSRHEDGYRLDRS